MIIPSRRRFLFGAGAAALLAAPALVHASSLMKLSVPRVPKLWGDGIHDDSAALQYLIDQQAPTGLVRFPPGDYRLGRGLWFDLPSDTSVDFSGTRLTSEFLPEHRDEAALNFDGEGQRIAVSNAVITGSCDSVFSLSACSSVRVAHPESLLRAIARADADTLDRLAKKDWIVDDADGNPAISFPTELFQKYS